VDKKTAHCLNSGKDKLYDILVLHLLGGKDIFITVCVNLITAFSKYWYIQVNV
jgi:phosphatidylinositol-bisphosphatase